MRETALFIGMALSLAASTARAQDWLVITATVRGGDPAAVRHAATSGAAMVGAATNASVMADQDAIARIETEITRPFEPLSRELTRRLGTAADTVLDHLVSGRPERALREGAPLLAEMDSLAVAIGRDETTARAAHNLCFYLVRAHLTDRHQREARDQAAVCIRLLPQMEPSERQHPPEVRRLYEEVRQDLSSGRQGGVLAVEAGPADPAGCAIRLNGRVVGHTPSVELALPTGDYAVQAECREGRPGRVQHVSLSRGSRERLVVHARLGQVLETQPALSLIYDDARALEAGLQEDVALIGRTVRVARVLVVTDVSNGPLGTRAYAITDIAIDLVGSAQMERPVDDTRVRGAIESVLGQRRTGADVIASAPPDEGRESDQGLLWPGVALAGAGVIALGIGWVFELSLEGSWDDLDRFGPGDIMGNEYARTLSDIENGGTPVLISSALGGALLVTSLPMWLPKEDGVPWWSWVASAVGVGVGAVGTYDLVRGGDPIGPQRSGSVVAQPAYRGALLLAHALPLMAIPVIYLVRPSEQVEVRASPGSVQLSVTF